MAQRGPDIQSSDLMLRCFRFSCFSGEPVFYVNPDGQRALNCRDVLFWWVSAQIS